MAPKLFDKIEFYFSLPMMIIMIVYSTYWFIYVLKHSTFRWVQFMLFLCVLQNLDTCWLVFLNYAAATPFH